ncbi:uncharacterized protein LOC110977868 [Acanthaster planci]|uniref:Uncharacterized protein LOC110977868 n=1 Tax=Acanthaster planci TaxID=133434 RepID=A0A8B7Y8J7_ACAPL|nr:uncharacterized protein LOC110977868 [Acanthaster planci]XP_022088072.1 uncharacterized protein LOC110977868 [Acanthaster planci]
MTLPMKNCSLACLVLILAAGGSVRGNQSSGAMNGTSTPAAATAPTEVTGQSTVGSTGAIATTAGTASTTSPAVTTANLTTTVALTTSAPPTTTLGLPASVNQSELIPTYQINDMDGHVCILAMFTATLKIKYDKTDGESAEAVIPFPESLEAYGECERYSMDHREFFFAYPNNSSYTLRLRFSFSIYKINQKPVGLLFPELEVVWTYAAPFFPDNAERLGREDGRIFTSFVSEMYGYSAAFKCDILTLSDATITLTLENMLVQPYADFGGFGYGDVCNPTSPSVRPVFPTTTQPLQTTEILPNATTLEATSNLSTTTWQPTSPVPVSAPTDHTGLIVGTVVGAVLAALVVAGAVCLIVRRRRPKQIPYGAVMDTLETGA